MTRREALVAGTTLFGSGPAKPATVDAMVVARNDAAVDGLLRCQVTDTSSRWCGSCPDEAGLYGAGSAAQVVEILSASLACSKSRFYGDGQLVQRIRLAAGFLERTQSADGFISLLTTNFNSPPDTGFVVHGVASGARVARMNGNEEVANITRRFLQKAGSGLAVGGIHTPNHRWVVSSALAQIDELFPDPRYLKRIHQWLSEGIDIDADGQFTERSMLTYNVICDRAFIVLSSKLKRADLLSPVRKNLHSLLYLLHGDGEVVTEISRRQDVNTRGDAGRYWFGARYVAMMDKDPQLGALAEALYAENATLGALLEYPLLASPVPIAGNLPEDYEKVFAELGIVRFRRKKTSATIMMSGNSRFFSLRHGAAVINAVRFASAFFGKGQFVPERGYAEGNGYVLTQSLSAPYYQPVDHPVDSRNWAEIRAQRKQTQICRLEQSATIHETPSGFKLRVQSRGTADVPVAVEINLREGGQLQNCRPTGLAAGSWVITNGDAVFRSGRDSISFGPGLQEQMYTQVRGAEPKLSGPSVYLTGFTPFDQTIEFKCT